MSASLEQLPPTPGAAAPPTPGAASPPTLRHHLTRTPMRILWLEENHPAMSYYDAIKTALEARGHNVSQYRHHSRNPLSGTLREGPFDAVLVGFGWMQGEPPLSLRYGNVRGIPEFSHRRCNASLLPRPYPASSCHCNRHGPLLVLLNKEYTTIPDKMKFLRAHCVAAAFSVHHEVARYEEESGVPFHRIWFGVDALRFSAGVLAAPPPAPPPPYDFDLGFTGVIRGDQTNNWRAKIWGHSWAKLRAHGLRLYSGPQGGVRSGVAHAELNSSMYVAMMRASRMWLSTTGPVDLVGTRYFEVMATGTTLCVCNRMEGEKALVYSSLGIAEGRHVAMFSTLPEFEALVINFTKRAEYEERRRAILVRAQELALRKFTWDVVAHRVERVMACHVNASGAEAAPCGGDAAERHSARGIGAHSAQSEK